jgi:hypothetical protein
VSGDRLINERSGLPVWLRTKHRGILTSDDLAEVKREAARAREANRLTRTREAREKIDALTRRRLGL